MTITNQILVVLLIGWRKFLSRHDQSEPLYPDLGGKRHQYGISALVAQTSFRRETSGGVAKYRLFSQATNKRTKKFFCKEKCPKKVRHFFFYSLVKVFMSSITFKYKICPWRDEANETQTIDCLVTLFTGTAGNYKGEDLAKINQIGCSSGVDKACLLALLLTRVWR